MYKNTLSIFKKEVKEIIRDRNTLLTIILISVLIGPAMLMMISNMMRTLETSAERRIVYIDGLTHSEIITNHLKRQTATLIQAPNDYETLIKQGKLKDPVLVIPENFDADWQNNITNTITIVSDASNGPSQAGVRRIAKWLQQLKYQHDMISLAVKGIKPNVPDIFHIEEKNLDNPKANFAKLFGMLPYFFILATFYATWSLSLEVSIGEKEKNTLSPLILTGTKTWEIVAGKWLAVSLIGILVCFLSAFSFLPAQNLMASETISSMFSYGLREAWICLIAVTPLSVLFVACVMWLGFKDKSYKQAQSKSTLVIMLATLSPVLFQIESQSESFLRYLPVLSSHHIIQQLLKDESYFQTLSIGMLLNSALTVLILYILHKKLKNYIS